MKRLVLALTILFAFALDGAAQQGDLVMNPDTLWFYHNGEIEYFTVTNEYNYPVQIDSMGDYGGYLLPGYDLPDLPYTIEPGGSVSFNFCFTYPVKGHQDLRDYVTTTITIYTSVGQRELPVMIDEAGMVNFVYQDVMYFDDPTLVIESSFFNKSVFVPIIRVFSIAEKDTDYLNIETTPTPPFDLEFNGEEAFMFVSLKDFAKGYVQTSIEIETDYGIFEIAVYINEEIITINGILTQVEAPYFDGNASDTRLAIVSGEETYYTTVDGYWPNPDGDALIVNFDTIPIGSEIEVGGTCSIMEDENGNIFKVFDIKRLTHPIYTSALGYLQKSAIALESSQFIYAWSIYDQKQPNTNPMTYFVTINGEIQTELPVLNGMQLNDSIRCTFVGIPGIILDYFGNSQNVLELTNVISYEPNFTVSGFLSTQGDLCLATPCGETPYLSLDEGNERHYLTLINKLQHNYINDIFFNEGVTAEIHGIEATHYDLFGAPFHTLDILEMETSVEKTLVGPMVSVPNPCIGFEWPLGMEFAFYHNGIEYYTPNVSEWYYPMGMNYLMCYIVDSDTLFAGKEVTANLTSTTMRIDNYLKPRYWATLNHAEYYDHLETLRGRLAITEEPYNMPVYAFVTNDNTTYLIEPYFLTYAEDDHIVINHDTLFVGDSFTATGEVFKWYDNSYEYFNFSGIHILEISDIVEPFPHGSEWYYEIQNENGSITYQYMYLAGDTIVQDEPTHILVKINTLYDKDIHEDVTHEYIKEQGGKVYWWNKTLGEFTTLYDFEAEEGDEWEIKVGTQSITVHVDVAQMVTFKSQTYRMLTISDPDDIFSGDIICGIGHLTSFFPEKLMDNGDGVRVEGLRCYWVEDNLVYSNGGEDCDAIYEELHGLEENNPSTDSEILTVYPNPTNGFLFVETHGRASLSDQVYRVTNLMGQTLMTGNITAETIKIDVSNLPEGMYFISIGGDSRKFVVK